MKHSEIDYYKSFATDFVVYQWYAIEASEYLGISDGALVSVDWVKFYENYVEIMVEDFSKDRVERTIYKIPIECVVCDEEKRKEVCERLKNKVVKE